MLAAVEKTLHRQTVRIVAVSALWSAAACLFVPQLNGRLDFSEIVRLVCAGDMLIQAGLILAGARALHRAAETGLTRQSQPNPNFLELLRAKSSGRIDSIIAVQFSSETTDSIFDPSHPLFIGRNLPPASIVCRWGSAAALLGVRNGGTGMPAEMEALRGLTGNYGPALLQVYAVEFSGAGLIERSLIQKSEAPMNLSELLFLLGRGRVPHQLPRATEAASELISHIAENKPVMELQPADGIVVASAADQWRGLNNIADRLERNAAERYLFRLSTGTDPLNPSIWAHADSRGLLHLTRGGVPYFLVYIPRHRRSLLNDSRRVAFGCNLADSLATVQGSSV